MSATGWILALGLFILIVFIVLAFSLIARNNQAANPDSLIGVPSAISSWSNVTSLSPCLLYEFPSGMINDRVLPGTPTLNSSILNSLTGVTTFPTCLDPDQIVAMKFSRTCIAVDNNTNSKCWSNNGQLVDINGTEIYYSNTRSNGVGCNAIPACPGQLAVISINYQLPDFKCIQNNGADNAYMVDCNPIEPNQLFRITRINLNQNPNTLVAGQGQNGMFAQILDRESGLCLTSSSNTDSTFVNCDGGFTQSGTGLNLQTCSGLTGASSSGGYVWAFVPSTQYCTSGTGCTAGQILITPPQITYVGNLPLSTFPSGATATINDQIKWFIDNNAMSLYTGGDDGLILAPFATNSSECSQQLYTAQYLNLFAYNTLSESEVCLADDFSNCVPL